MKLEIRTLPHKHVACLAHRGAYHKIGETFEELFRWVRRGDVPFQGVYAIYYDDPACIPEEHLRSDAAVEVPERFTTGNPRVELKEIEAGLYAIGLHVGHYSGLSAAWDEAFAEARNLNLKVRFAPCIEHYVDDMSKVPADQLRTELYIPLIAEQVPSQV